MESQERNERKKRIQIKSKNGHGIRLETIDQFYDSYFEEAYLEAFKQTQRIAKQNKKYREEGNLSFQERHYNIITFCGARGTGKSSILYSFVEALKNVEKVDREFFSKYKSNQKKELKALKGMLEESEFLCLEEIDASLLEQEEDILDVILARMFQELHQKTMAYKKDYLWSSATGEERINRDSIIRSFEEIYRKKYNLQRGEHRYDRSESPVEVLNNLSGSLALRELIREFLPKYLSAVTEQGTANGKKKYLVISIDDLDMNPHGYTMLEQLHRYLMVPGIIIYLAVSGQKIRRLCEKHFEDAELSQAYLEKVLPFAQRIFLSEQINNSLKVKIVPDELPIKDTILRKIVSRTRVYFDGCGQRTHFYETGNLRRLVNLYCFLDNMEKLPSDETNNWHFLEELDTNLEKLGNDIIERLAVNLEQREVFRAFYREDVARNGRYFVDWIVEALRETKMGEGKFVRDYERLGYSYGELLRGLYILGKESTKYNELIDCVLAMETVMATKIYQHMLYEEEEKERYAKKWKDYISGSICGSWGNSMLPMFKKGSDTGKDGTGIRIGYIKDVSVGEWSVDPELQSMEAFEECKALIETYDIVKVMELLFGAVIRTKDYIGTETPILSFSRKEFKKKEDKENTAQESGESKTEGEDEVKRTGAKAGLKINFAKRAYTFDVFGFAVESIRFDEVQEMLLSAMKNYCQNENCPLDEIRREELAELMRKNSMNDNEQSMVLPLPLYSADIMYNLFRRVKAQSEADFTGVMGTDESIEFINELYKIVEKRLAEQDLFYGNANGQNSPGFKTNFEQCLFIKGFRELKNNENSLLKKVVKAFFEAVYDSEIIQDIQSTMEN